MKLAILILIRTSQGVLISAGIPTLFLLAVLFAWSFILFMSLQQLRDLLQIRTTPVQHLKINDLMQKTYKYLDATNLNVNAIHAPNILQINNK